MLFRARSRSVALSVRQFRDGLVISAVHKYPLFLSEVVEAGKEVYREIRELKEGESRTLWEIVAESNWEEALIRGPSRFTKSPEGNLDRYTWRLPLPRREEENGG